ncbi:MAG: xanthine dehydrogenase family protein molybdopterin-binding subunit [Armatimonadota bacterium]|nr:xanthine dehydrogenase family protein molybdopterin-binding subunit [Armatimonadota bacterium]MDR5688415.1 xanthine dehydrogenase family protein molybdopterin-binding subunit [Armatimonadota bacterium]MDR7598482.1 xanthine dehydrogenase family protein molybdopterin-binding subunit [Armatimonadota bacterium]
MRVEHAPPAGGWVGRPLRRKEDGRFLRGQARYVDDLKLPGMLHLVVVRSPYAHARVLGVRVEAARATPGVVAVFTGRDLAGRLGQYALAGVEGTRVEQVPHPVLATDRVRYVGEPVAAVVAETRAAAEDAAAVVEVDYDPLPAVVDPEESLTGAVRLHEQLPDNVLFRWEGKGGDPDGEFARADRVVRQKFRIPRLAAVPMETRGAVAVYEPGSDLLTVWASAQGTHRPREQLSRILRRPEERIRFIVPDVGGAFGSKFGVSPETVLAAWAALVLGCPVKWVEDRRENLLASYQGRGMVAEVEVAVRGNRMVALRARLLADAGAYLYPSTPVPPVNTAMLMTGAYAIPHAHVVLLGVATNKVPTGPYRGAGRPEAAYLVERMAELVARELHEDPVAFRMRHLVRPDAFPYRNPLGFVYDSGDYPRALERLRELLEYDRWREEQERARANGRLVGVGVAFYVERAASQLWESAAVVVEPTGRVVVRTGSVPHGQGHETSFAQIAADLLQVHPDDVLVQYGDTNLLGRSIGTFGSRSTTLGGSAIVVAAEKIRAKAKLIAAHLLEASPDDLDWQDGRIWVRGVPERVVSWRDVASAAYQPHRLPPDLEMGLEAVGYFAIPRPVFPYGAYGAVVEVDPETGEVKVLKLVAVDDAGRIVNPLLAEGQISGSVVQALGQAFTEAFEYDDQGQPLASSLAEYGLPRAVHAPPLVSEFLETPSPLNPLGAKGLGEAGTIGAPPAIANAVLDALEPFGVRHLDFPFTAERVWRALRAGR